MLRLHATRRHLRRAAVAERCFRCACADAYLACDLLCSSPRSILDLPDADLIQRCPVCSYQMKFTGDSASYEKLSISTKYSTASSLAEDEPAQVPAFTRAKVKERCPQCNNPEMSFYTVSGQAGLCSMGPVELQAANRLLVGPVDCRNHC
jgi:DNA-directed RNA polymerase subunit M/transcription elongation factor TFIIS